jgi:hypothetical protein
MKNIPKTILLFCSLALFLLPFTGCSQYGYERRGMFNDLGVGEIVIIVLIIFIYTGLFVFVVRRILQISRPAIILEKFNIDDSPSAQKPIEIVGHAYGLKAWLLFKMGFDSETKLSVYDSKITFKRSGFIYGETHQVIPMINISSVFYGYSKPFDFLIIGIIFLFFGHYLLASFILGAILIIAYFFVPKKIFISLKIIGGTQVSFSFKPNLVENVDVNIEQAHKVINIINDNILIQHGKN